MLPLCIKWNLQGPEVGRNSHGDSVFWQARIRNLIFSKTLFLEWFEEKVKSLILACQSNYILQSTVVAYFCISTELYDRMKNTHTKKGIHRIKEGCGGPNFVLLFFATWWEVSKTMYSVNFYFSLVNNTISIWGDHVDKLTPVAFVCVDWFFCCVSTILSRQIPGSPYYSIFFFTFVFWWILVKLVPIKQQYI